MVDKFTWKCGLCYTYKETNSKELPKNWGKTKSRNGFSFIFCNKHKIK